MSDLKRRADNFSYMSGFVSKIIFDRSTIRFASQIRIKYGGIAQVIAYPDSGESNQSGESLLEISADFAGQSPEYLFAYSD
jgi:hypothetical protein